jgi:hypothetical protein
VALHLCGCSCVEENVVVASVHGSQTVSQTWQGVEVLGIMFRMLVISVLLTGVPACCQQVKLISKIIAPPCLPRPAYRSAVY